MGIKRPALLFSHLKNSFGLRRELRKITYSENLKGTAVFNTAATLADDITSELYYAYLVACAGIKVKFLFDDFTLEHWDQHQDGPAITAWKTHRGAKNRAFRTSYNALGRMVFAHPNIEFINYSEALREVPDELPLNAADLAHARDSMMRYFQTGQMNLEDPRCQEYYEACLKNCNISKRIGAYIDRKHRPDFIFSSHGCYSVWGPAYDYLIAKGYTYLIYGMQVYKDREVHIHDSLPRFMTESSQWKKFKDKPLTAEERTEITTYFDSRLKVQTVDTKIFYKGISEFERLKIDTHGAKAVFGLFPNVIWDADLSHRNYVFDNPVEWVVKSIQFFEQHPEFHLIIRFHPSEASMAAHVKQLEALVRKHVPTLDSIKNITVISAGRRVKSYDLIEDYVDVGLVYEGVLGVELPYLGLPVITAARSRYQNAGNSFEAPTEKQYFDLVANPAGVLKDFASGSYREKSLVFGYWYFFATALWSPIIKKGSYGYLNYEAKAADLDPASSAKTRRTLKHILGFLTPQKKPVLATSRPNL